MIGVLLWVACSAPEPPQVPPDVVFVTLDTTRADRLGAYGHVGGATPTLDALAARGRTYDHAVSPVPLTIPSHASLFTGRYPARLQVRSNGDATLSPAVTTLAERLAGHGYRTAASVGAFVTTRVWGFDQGFERYFDTIPAGRDGWHAQRPGSEVVDDLVRWERETRADPAPRFVWAHLYDPHHPYHPWPDLVQRVGGRPYDAELAYVDGQIDRLLDAFSERPTLVVVVGDHGEALGEHGELAHGWYVYGATQRVPWIVAGPGVAPGERVAAPVSLVDVAPTVLDLLGLPGLPDPDGSPTPGGPVFSESWQLTQRFGLAPHLAVIDGPLKLIDLPEPELYDLAADPAEHINLAGARPDDVARLRAILHDRAFPEPAADPAHLPAADVSAQLAQLGYVAAGVVGASGPRADPKRHRELLHTLQALDQRIPGGDGDAIADLRGLVVRYPHITELRTRLAGELLQVGDVAAASSVVRQALDRDPDNVPLRIALAQFLVKDRRFLDAAVLYCEAAEAMPWQPRLRVMCVLALMDGGTPVPAAEQALAWSEATPDDAAIAGLAGVALVKAGRFDDALPLLERGVLADPPERGVAYHLSAARMGRGQVDEARAMLDLELDHHPGSLEALQARAALFARDRDWMGQLVRVEAALAVRPEDPTVRHLQAQTLYNLQRFDEARQVLDGALSDHPEASALLLLDANLLRQEGRGDAAVARFEQAKAARAREDAAAAARPHTSKVTP